MLLAKSFGLMLVLGAAMPVGKVLRGLEPEFTVVERFLNGENWEFRWFFGTGEFPKNGGFIWFYDVDSCGFTQLFICFQWRF